MRSKSRKQAIRHRVAHLRRKFYDGLDNVNDNKLIAQLDTAEYLEQLDREMNRQFLPTWDYVGGYWS